MLVSCQDSGRFPFQIRVLVPGSAKHWPTPGTAELDQPTASGSRQSFLAVSRGFPCSRVVTHNFQEVADTRLANSCAESDVVTRALRTAVT